MHMLWGSSLEGALSHQAMPAPHVHEARAVHLLGRQKIVCAAAHSHVLDRALAASSDWRDMVILEERALFAAHAVLAHERAALAIAFGHAALHLRRDVARVAGGRLRLRRTGVTELALLEALHELGQRELQHLRHVAAGPGMRQQLLGALDQVMRVLPDRELHREASRGDGGDARVRRGQVLGRRRGRPVIGRKLPRGNFA
jgi:hypothetical protein